MSDSRVSRWVQPFVDDANDEPINVTPHRLRQGDRLRPDRLLRARIDAFHAEQVAKSKRLWRCSLQGWGLCALLLWYAYSTLPGPHILAWWVAVASGGFALYAWYKGRLAREFSALEPD